MPNTKDGKVVFDPVDDYEESPPVQRSTEDTAVAEARLQEDQIPDYHKENPTLEPGPAHEADPVELAMKKARPLAREIKAEVRAEEAAEA
jgi:hypothetical protein